MSTGRRFLCPAMRVQRGLSLVEVLVGVAVGLFVVAAAAMLTSTQLSSNRRMVTETQVQQDMRATADIITRELRRTGGWTSAHRMVWTEIGTPAISKHPSLSILSPASGSDTATTFAYDRGMSGIGGAHPQTGFELDSSNTRIRTLLASPSGWQSLTDENTLKILPRTGLTAGFTVSARHVAEPSPAAGPQRMPCPKLCPDGTTDCWPSVQVRELTVVIKGEATSDSAVKRDIRSIVRLRNDEVLADPAGICPA